MAIKIVIERPGEYSALYKHTVEPDDGQFVADFVDGKEQTLYVVSPEDDLGGMVFRYKCPMEDIIGRPVGEGEAVELEIPTEMYDDENLEAELPVADTIELKITSEQGTELILKLHHIGSMALSCYPDTRYPQVPQLIHLDEEMPIINSLS